MGMNAISDMLRPKESATKGQRKVVQKDQLPCRRSLDSWVVCLKIFVREKFVLLEQEKLVSKHTVKFSKGPWNQIKIRERKVPSRGIILKWSPHEGCPCAPKFGERRLFTKKDAPAKQRGIWREIFTSSRI